MCKIGKIPFPTHDNVTNVPECVIFQAIVCRRTVALWERKSMTGASREFQVFAKPAGALCNLGCQYCYYLDKQRLYPQEKSFRMPDDLLEEYIAQHIDACTEPVISFSWHGGEPTILGLDYFRKIVMLQRKHRPADRHIVNGIQTNGTLLDEDWCRFLAGEQFAVGISLDGPQEIHDRYRVTKDGRSVFEETMRGYRLLQQHQVSAEVLCVVSSHNVRFPSEVYRFFRELGAPYLSFLPLVERRPEAEGGVSERTVPAEAWGEFLCAIFDEWKARDIGRVKVQIFEEAVRPAFGQEHTLCVFKQVCGGVPVVEHNGDFYCCDHFVDAEHRLGNIRETPLVRLLESPTQRAFGRAKLDTLPRYCQACEVRAMCNGGCPKDRFLVTPAGEPGLNYLCAGYRRFFTHCQPFVAEVAALWHRTDPPAESAPAQETGLRLGRNDPCPCGSGRKYKNCCLRR
jgi:uncharacterized protein